MAPPPSLRPPSASSSGVAGRSRPLRGRVAHRVPHDRRRPGRELLVGARGRPAGRGGSTAGPWPARRRGRSGSPPSSARDPVPQDTVAFVGGRGRPRSGRVSTAWRHQGATSFRQAVLVRAGRARPGRPRRPTASAEPHRLEQRERAAPAVQRIGAGVGVPHDVEVEHAGRAVVVGEAADPVEQPTHRPHPADRLEVELAEPLVRARQQAGRRGRTGPGPTGPAAAPCRPSAPPGSPTASPPSPGTMRNFRNSRSPPALGAGGAAMPRRASGTSG